MRHLFADGGYPGDKLKDALSGIGDSTIEIVKRSDKAKGFEILPRRWVVERTLAWLQSHNRRRSPETKLFLPLTYCRLNSLKAGRRLLKASPHFRTRHAATSVRRPSNIGQCRVGSMYLAGATLSAGEEPFNLTKSVLPTITVAIDIKRWQRTGICVSLQSDLRLGGTTMIFPWRILIRALVAGEVSMAIPARADIPIDPQGSGVIIRAVDWLQGTLLGTVATVVAVIAVAAVGFAMLTGRINWRHGSVVVLGCFILFGAASIVAGIRAAAGG